MLILSVFQYMCVIFIIIAIKCLVNFLNNFHFLVLCIFVSYWIDVWSHLIYNLNSVVRNAWFRYSGLGCSHAYSKNSNIAAYYVCPKGWLRKIGMRLATSSHRNLWLQDLTLHKSIKGRKTTQPTETKRSSSRSKTQCEESRKKSGLLITSFHLGKTLEVMHGMSYFIWGKLQNWHLECLISSG